MQGSQRQSCRRGCSLAACCRRARLFRVGGSWLSSGRLRRPCCSGGWCTATAGGQRTIGQVWCGAALAGVCTRRLVEAAKGCPLSPLAAALAAAAAVGATDEPQGRCLGREEGQRRKQVHKPIGSTAAPRRKSACRPGRLAACVHTKCSAIPHPTPSTAMPPLNPLPCLLGGRAQRARHGV